MPFYAFCLLPSLGHFLSGLDDRWTPTLALVTPSGVAGCQSRVKVVERLTSFTIFTSFCLSGSVTRKERESEGAYHAWEAWAVSITNFLYFSSFAEFEVGSISTHVHLVQSKSFFTHPHYLRSQETWLCDSSYAVES